MDYGAAAAKYINAFMQNVNWDEVNRRVEEIRIRKCAYRVIATAASSGGDHGDTY